MSKLQTLGGADPWGLALKILMSAVVLMGGVIAACFRYLNVAVLQKAADAAAPGAAAGGLAPKKKKKPSMGVRESVRYLAASPYIRNLATLVVSYGMAINLVEVTWKAKLKQAFPNPTDYSSFMGGFSCTPPRLDPGTSGLISCPSPLPRCR